MQSENQFYSRFDEIPIFNFVEFMTSNDFNLILRERIPEVELESLTEVVNSIWEDIFDEYLNYMGLGANWERIIKQEKRIAKLVAERWLKEKPHLQGIINIERKKLEQLRKIKGSGSDIFEDAAAISKYMGFNINVRTTTAKEFFSYIKLMQKDGENK